MSPDKIKKALVLLVHDGMDFVWCQSIVAAFHQQASKNGFSLQVVHRRQEIILPDSPVVLLGVDKSWVCDNVKALENEGRRVILLSGIIEKVSGNVSRIIDDHDDLIRKSIAHLRQSGRDKIAFFGVQKKDTSDENKAACFAALVSEDHVYRIDETIEECFTRLHARICEYNGIVCANDIIAVYLLAKCRSLGIMVPGQLCIVGNGNLWIGAHTKPSLTTISVDVAKVVAITLRLCKDFYSLEEVASVDVYIKASLICRESTGHHREETTQQVMPKASHFFYEENNTDNELAAISRIDRTMASLSPEKQKILAWYLQGDTYAAMAQRVHCSEEALRYHMKKIYKLLHVHSKKECASLLNRYLGGL